MNSTTNRATAAELRILELRSQVERLKLELAARTELLSAACDVLEAAGHDSPRTLCLEAGLPDPCKMPEMGRKEGCS
jgi:hypothetical protein